MIAAPKTAPRAGLIAVVGLTAAGLFALDQFLARMEKTELGREAAQEYAAGAAALRAGKPVDALPHLSRARSLVRGNPVYQLTLAEAQAAAGNLTNAESNIRELLVRNSNDAEANLAMARLSGRLGRPDDANAFYHRAIFGEWRSDAQRHRRESRLELADYLASQNRRQELLSELLMLGADAQSDPVLARHIARLLLAAGSSSRAANAYRDIIRANPDDVEAYRGLGEAELQAGDFRRAQTAYLDALRRKADDRELAKRLQFATTLTQTDPTLRRLPSAEKYRRSAALLDSVRDHIAACAGTEPLPADLNTWMTDSATRLAAKPRGRLTNEDAESLLTLAERLWAERPPDCRIAPDDPVSLLMEKVKAQ